jgi:hypothetical protein
MSGPIPLDDPENYVRVMQRIKRLWREGPVQITSHAQKRMEERDLDINDVQSILRTGKIVEHSCPRELWNYKVQGVTVESKKAACVVAINGLLIIVTVMEV